MHVVVRLPALAFCAYFLISPLRGQPAGERPGKSSSDAPTFVDVAASSGVDFKNDPSPTSQKYLPESMVGGVAMLDYNGDGLLDLYFVNGAGLEDPMPPEKSPDKSEPRYWNRLYRNNGDGTFSDTTESAGVAGESYGQGVAVGDYDNDGRPDLYVTNFGPNNLYRNEGDGTFRQVTREAGVSGGGWSAGAMFLDYDRDGHLDLIVSRYLIWDFDNNRWCGEKKPGYRAYCHPDHFEPLVHIVYHNNGDGTFGEATKASGVGASPGKGLGVAFNDFDRDGWPDLLVANDSAPQQLFRNRGDGTFEEVGLFAGVAFDADGNTFAGMGVDFADYDNDGWPDAVINALAEQRYSLYRNVSGDFEYHSEPSGVSSITLMHSGWGMKFIDYDNDGWKDVFVAQGHVVDNVRLTKPALRYKEPLLLARNVKGKFEDVSEQSGPPFHIPRAGRGAAFGDLDNDGFLDVAVNCNRESAVVLKNSGNRNHWLIVKTIGALSNRDGMGAQLRLVSESGQEQYGLVTTAGSYLSAGDRRVHFGLGSDKRVKLLEITWPSGTRQRFEDVAGDQILTVREPDGSEEERPAR